MSDKLREAAKAVGDAKDILFLREMSVHDKVYLRLEDAINALKAALAEPAIKDSLTTQRPWVGLTDGEILEMFGVVGTSGSDINPRGLLKDTRRIEAKLKEKNGG